MQNFGAGLPVFFFLRRGFVFSEMICVLGNDLERRRRWNLVVDAAEALSSKDFARASVCAHARFPCVTNASECGE